MLLENRSSKVAYSGGDIVHISYIKSIPFHGSIRCDASFKVSYQLCDADNTEQFMKLSQQFIDVRC